MSELKYCQGTRCHQHQTQDRIRGSKGNKTYQTRRRSSFYYGNGNFCSIWCLNDWFNDFGDKAIDHFGRTTEPKKLTEQNAWQKTYDWNSNRETVYVYLNTLTKEKRPLTEAQYDDSNYTLNTGE
jgi:hypothetical protein